MRIIGHLDMDAFFAAIEERDTPRFSGLPIVIGANPQNGKGRGVVSTANYKAREYGIHSALPISKAWQFSEWAKKRGEPEAVFIEPDMEKYEIVSDRIAKVVEKDVGPSFVKLKIERSSIDEMYMDFSFAGSYAKAQEICARIKDEIKKKEKLTCSIGVGPNKLIAKIASDFKKPDGLTIVEPEKVDDFLSHLPIRKIPGIGPKTEMKLQGMGIVSMENLKSMPLEKLKNEFGKWGLDIYNKIRGIDDSPVQEFYEAKSIGEQETFPKDTLEASYIIDRLDLMCQNVIKRLIEERFESFKTIVITARFTGFTTKTRAHTLKKPADSLVVLKREAIKLLMPFLDKRENPEMKKIRLIGVRVEKLV
jgi:DNA polymerase IV (DinB-like DNA polymerase)